MRVFYSLIVVANIKKCKTLRCKTKDNLGSMNIEDSIKLLHSRTP